MPTVLLARHGETTWNRKGRIQGWAPTPLTARGREQARRLAAEIDAYSLDRIYASDLRRTRQTVAPVAERTGVDPAYERAWRERDFGRLQGISKRDLYERFPEYSVTERGMDGARARPESGESVVDVYERITERWETLAESLGADETVLVVTHGGPLRLLSGAIAGLDPADAGCLDSHGNCALTELSLGEEAGGDLPSSRQTRPDGVEVLRENDTAFLPR